jgi:hypothetical protein
MPLPAIAADNRPRLKDMIRNVDGTRRHGKNASSAFFALKYNAKSA